jgi:hypothetical protein
MDYSSKETTQDGLFLVPNGVDAQHQLSCSFDSETNTMFGLSSYQASAIEHVEFTRKLRVLFAASTASVDFQRVAESTNKSNLVFMEAAASCTFWYFQIEGFKPPKFTENFEAMVRELARSNSSDNQTLVDRIIFNFGTHVSVKSVIGAFFAIQSKFESTTFHSRVDLELDLKAAVSIDLLIAAAGMEAVSERDLELVKVLEQTRTAKHRLFVGSLPPRDGTWQSWAASASKAPRPVKFTLRPLCDVIHIDNFPDLDPDDVQRAHDALEQGIEDWCYRSGKNPEFCEGPPPDPVHHKFRLQTVTTDSSASFKCRDGLQPIAVGIVSRTPRMSHDRAPTSYALDVLDGSTATCSGEAITCTAICTTAFAGAEIDTGYLESKNEGHIRSERQRDPIDDDVRRRGTGIRVVTSGVAQGASFARCDEGFKLASCGFIEHSLNPNDDMAVSAYPIDDRTCACQDKNPASISQCQATCVPADVLSSYHIEQAAGEGTLTVECERHMTLLGCGYRESSAMIEHDPYWYVGPMSTRACQCKNDFGATCYSICAAVRPADAA